ncbi:MAG: SIMPL domain-containing protein [Pseudomonadota bacterium]|nr:SIMPL domain-containing protein [Pseudomonadota bacterium]
MQNMDRFNALALALGVFLGLTALGWLIASAAIDVKEYERSVTVKGLAEEEFTADVVIWPIQFTLASNNLPSLYQDIDTNTGTIISFLTDQGIERQDITIGTPAITDKSAQQYGNQNRAEFRYTGMQTVTVYSDAIETVREVMGKLSELGKQGIVLTGNNYQSQTEYLFTRLNEVKPAMIEDATRKAREVAEKFAEDSDSRLGKIRRASQGQFSISPRDNNTPHIKKVRVVSTIEYYLSD